MVCGNNLPYTDDGISGRTDLSKGLNSGRGDGISKVLISSVILAIEGWTGLLVAHV